MSIYRAISQKVVRMIVEWAPIYIIHDASIKPFEKARTWHVVPVSNDLMDTGTESEFAPWDPSKAHILVSTPVLGADSQCKMLIRASKMAWQVVFGVSILRSKILAPALPAGWNWGSWISSNILLDLHFRHETLLFVKRFSFLIQRETRRQKIMSDYSAAREYRLTFLAGWRTSREHPVASDERQ